jgi:hypothetical protein
MKATSSLGAPAVGRFFPSVLNQSSLPQGARSNSSRSRHPSSTARVLAILLLALVLALALFSKGFRFGRDCERTIGEEAPFGQAFEICDWFPAR